MSDNLESNEAGSEESGTSEENQESTEQNMEASESSEESTGEAGADSALGTSQEEEWLIPGRFKKGEESKLAESYRQLESEFSRRNNELHRYRNQATQPPKIDPIERTRQFADDVKRDPVEAINKIIDDRTSALKQETATVRFESEFKHLMQNKEFAELEPVMANVALQYEDLIIANNLRNDPRLLHILFDIAKGKQMESKARKAEQKGQQKGERNAMRKTKAQIEGNSGTQGHKSVDIEKMTASQLKDAIVKGKVKV